MDTQIKKDSALISVIVPVYKSEKYLAQCLENLIYQTYRHLEIIIIDDGSPDDSWKIAEEYQQKDIRIRFVRQANAGAAAARNKGLELATGEYIHFMDSDDYVNLEFYEKMLYLALREEADLVCCASSVLTPNFTASTPSLLVSVKDRLLQTSIWGGYGMVVKFT